MAITRKSTRLYWSRLRRDLDKQKRIIAKIDRILAEIYMDTITTQAFMKSRFEEMAIWMDEAKLMTGLQSLIQAAPDE